MQIEVKGRHMTISDDIREHVEKRFAKVGKQVSEAATMEVELRREQHPGNPEHQVAEVTLHLKGTQLRARDASRDMVHSINLCADELSRQVKRHREKRRARRASRALSAEPLPEMPPGDGISAAL